MATTAGMVSCPECGGLVRPTSPQPARRFDAVAAALLLGPPLVLLLAAIACYEAGVVPSAQGGLALFGVALCAVPCAAAALSRVNDVRSGLRGCITCFLGGTIFTAVAIFLDYLLFILYIGLRVG